MATEKTKKRSLDKLSTLISELKSTGADIYIYIYIYIYNVDETGLAMVNRSGRITAPKGYKTVIMKKGRERSENIISSGCNTVVLCRFLGRCFMKIFPKGCDP
jgi:hypothetical protein